MTLYQLKLCTPNWLVYNILNGKGTFICLWPTVGTDSQVHPFLIYILVEIAGVAWDKVLSKELLTCKDTAKAGA